MDAFAAAAAESLGWLISGVSQQRWGVRSPGRAAAAGQKDPQQRSFRTQHSWLSGGGVTLDVASQDPLTRPARRG